MKRNKKIDIYSIAVWTVVIIVILLTLKFTIGAELHSEEYVVTITGKDRITESSGSGDNRKIESKYIVFCDDENGNSMVFENTDTIIHGKFNSSNVQGQLKVGCEYKLTVVGYRIPFMSMYQNIIKVEEAE